jgi:uncharacterized Zn-binding protein involved in type VI secretion
VTRYYSLNIFKNKRRIKMGKPASRLGDVHSGHSCFAVTKSVSASSNVIINGKGALRSGDSYVPHKCGPSSHTPVQQEGSSTVIINGKKCARLGDATACGAKLMVGSTNVLVGG